MIRDRLIPIALAISFVTFAAWADDTDYALIAGVQRICAKDREACELARQAIRYRYLDWFPADTPTRCEHSPGCFSARSNCIQGYSC